MRGGRGTSGTGLTVGTATAPRSSTGGAAVCQELSEAGGGIELLRGAMLLSIQTQCPLAAAKREAREREKERG